jgi:excisionase family DNA binding protein
MKQTTHGEPTRLMPGGLPFWRKRGCMKEISAREACKKLGISLDAMYRLVWADKIPARKEGKAWLVPVPAIEARIAGRKG